ncbi:MAG: ribokinase [Eubacteriales bacterium]|nr:ribokinase [Eubacteriales bacterium]
MKKIVVMGSFVVDLMSRADHLPAPGETVRGTYFQSGPGGKGFNQGVAARKAGGDVLMSTKIARDIFGQVAEYTMDELGLAKDYLFYANDRATGTALILVDEHSSQNAIMVVPGAAETFTEDEVNQVIAHIDENTILLTQLEINLPAVYQVIRAAKERGATVVLNPAPYSPFDRDILAYVDIITPNEIEACGLTGTTVDTAENARVAAAAIRAMGVPHVIITWGDKGAYVLDDTLDEIIPPVPVKALDTTGAGDAFNGALVTALAEGCNLKAAVRFANAAAALSVQKLGTTNSMADRAAIDALLKEGSSD